MIQELNKGLADKNVKNSPNKSISLNKQSLLTSPDKNQPEDDILLKNSPSKQKYIPSRYGVNEVMQSNNTLSKTALLSDLQQQMQLVDDEMSKMSPEKINNRLKEMKSYHPPSRIAKVSEFKSKPIKKSESDLLMFKEIFVVPKEKVLHDLREKEKAFTELIHEGASKQYDKIIGVDKDESKNIKAQEQKLKREKVHFSTPKLADPNDARLNTLGNKDVGLVGMLGGMNKDKSANVYKSHDKLQVVLPTDDDDKEQLPEIPKTTSNERVFFEQQIQVYPPFFSLYLVLKVQAPETPNYTTASPLTPGIN